jgi:CPA2 family monovalent cation:H+ antiporter-2
LLLFFSIAGIIVPLLQRINISPVLSYIVTGICIGPFGIGQFSHIFPWVSYVSITNTHTVNTLGELGIISLMFMIGLELSLERLKEFSRLIFGLGALQIITTTVLIFPIMSYIFGYNTGTALLLAASFSLSSTAIVMKLLEEERLINRPIGMICFSILLMQDLAVVPILVLATSLTKTPEANVLITLLQSVLLSTGVVTAVYWFGNKLITPLIRSVSLARSSEWLPAFTVFLVSIFSILTNYCGLSFALGGFIAGLLVAKTEFNHEIDTVITPLKGILLGIFFLSIGMMINVTQVLQQPFTLLGFLLGLYFLKAVVIFLLCLIFRIELSDATEAALYLAQPGEFALMILGVAISTNLLPKETVQFYLILTVLGMMLTPLLFKIGSIIRKKIDLFYKDKEISDTIEIPQDKEIVIIAGFGRVGNLIAETLEKACIGYIAFDNDGKKVQEGRKENISLFYGNAGKNELWKHLMQYNIQAVFITIDDYQNTKFIVSLLRKQYPLLTIIVRSKSNDDLNILYEEGATEVIAETIESSLRMVELLMEKLGKEQNETERIIESIRIKYEKM